MLHLCLAVISLIGLVMNGYILIVVLLTKQVSANNILLIHLGLVDVLLCFFFFSFALPPIASGYEHNWLYNSHWCTLEGLLLALLHPMAIWSTCGLNCDRFYAIASPLHYSAIVNPRRALIGLGCGWLVVLSLAVPPIATQVAPFQLIPEVAACFPRFNDHNSIYYSGTYILVTFLCPAVIILGCNIKVLQIAKRHRHRIASAIYEVTLSAQVTITHQRNPFFVPTITAPSAGGPRFRSRSPVSSTASLVGSFLLLYCPYYGALLFQGVSAYLPHNPTWQPYGNYLQIIAAGLLVSAPSVNGALYGLKSKVLRNYWRNYLRKQKSKNEVNHEIQARTPSTCGSRRPSLTPFGLGRPCLQRQMSELFFDAENHLPGPGSQIKRTSSELAWPTNSNGGASSERRPGDATIPHTASCSTLIVPHNGESLASTAEQELYLTIKNSFRSATLKNPNANGSPNPRNFTLNISGHNSQVNGHRYKYTNLLANTNRTLNGGAKFLNKVLRFDSHHTQERGPFGASERRASVQPQILITSACSVDQGSGDEASEWNREEKEERMDMGSTEDDSREQHLLDTCLDPTLSSYIPQDTSEENTTTITTIAHSVTPKLITQRVQSLDDAYREGSPTSSLSENEEQTLLLSWPMVNRKIRIAKAKSPGFRRPPVDDEDIEMVFKEEPSKTCKSNRMQSPDVASSSESISSSLSLFSDRRDYNEIII